MAETTALVPVFTGTLANLTVQLCDARALHTFMEVKRDFSNWIKGRIRKFGFTANEDYLLAKSGEQVPHQGGTRTVERIDYHLTLDMAKELSMVENNEQGRAARKYFIACEREALAQPTALPYSVQPGDVLSLAQGDELRAMLESAAQKLPAEKRGPFLQSGWAKLRAHTGVNYRKIPQAAVTDALSLLARHVVAWDLVDDTAQLPGNAQATPAAAQPAPSPAAPTLRNRRWLIATDFEGRETVQPIAPDDFIVNWRNLVQDVATGGCLRTSAELLDMASACMRRLQQRSSPARLSA